MPHIDANIPLWGIILLITPILWQLVTLYFSNKNNIKQIGRLEDSIVNFKISNKESIEKLEKELFYQEKAINTFKKDIEQKLDDHKKATDNKLSNINDSIVETKTLVRLLVDNKIK